MWPRLKLLHELLADDGVIFVSIDDNEVHHLRAIMDEIWGEENFVADIIWQKKYAPQNDAKYFSDNHDFILVCAKKKDEWQLNLLPRTKEMDARYSNPDDDSRGNWKAGDLSVKSYSEKYDYPITTPSGRLVEPPKGRCWRVSKEGFQKLVDDNRIWFGVDNNNVPAVKRFLSEVKQGMTPLTIWKYDEVGHNQDAVRELQNLGLEDLFSTPKPTTLLKHILQLATNKDSIILDSFAGSGTTARAVLDLNTQDGGNRKFILIECETYANTITAERVRRVIKGVPTAKDKTLKQGLGGSFTFATLGDEFNIEKMLTGEALPEYSALADYVFYTATGKSLPMKISAQIKFNEDFYVGETDLYQIYLIYKLDIAFLRSNDSALNGERVARIASHSKHSTQGKTKLVFATAKYMGQKELTQHKITFCQLPYAIHKIVG